MEQLEKILNKKAQLVSPSKPVIFDFSIASDQKIVVQLIEEQKIQHITNDYKEQLKELFQVNNPTLVYTPDFGKEFDQYYVSLNKNSDIWQQGRWVYFPWISTLVHILEEKDFFR